MLSFFFLAAAIGSGFAQASPLNTPEITQNACRNGTIFQSPQPHLMPNSSQAACSYWMEDIKHQGVAAFNSDPSNYQVFRNVKDFGAVGDGVTDDTAAINSAISSGNRCAFGSCQSSTTTPAVVYFPAGTYALNSSIVDYYYTQLIGNPNCLPVLRPLPTYGGSGLGVIEGDPYEPSGNLAVGATNVFWRQVRNFIIEMTLVPAEKSVTGIHWPTAQATSIQNVQFLMSSASGTQHQGIYIESGSGGFMTDLTFDGGLYGGSFGNQQFTMRNFTFNNVKTAINQVWDWGWTYSGMTINNCSVGLNMSADGQTDQATGSVTFFDSEMIDTPVGIITAHSANSQPATGGSLILENISLDNVPVAVQGASASTALAGCTGSCNIDAWGEGHSYTSSSSGPNVFEGTITGVSRPASLLGADGKYYARSKPQYENVPSSGFLSARDAGATGDGHTDDTTALQQAVNQAVQQQKVLYVDHGDYLVSGTIIIPAGAKIVGESYSVILSTGSFFNDINNPKPVVQIGQPGEVGSIEWSDMIVSTQGQQAGAILFQYNLAAPAGTPSGLWDVHSRVGGFAGSNLQLAECPTTPNSTVTAGNMTTSARTGNLTTSWNANLTTPAFSNQSSAAASSKLVQSCIAAYITMHLTKGSTGFYAENSWLWTADHDIEDANLTQITVYSGRGLLVESAGPTWLVGSAVEHHTLYQYQFVGASDVFAGQVQTETAYYQPNPSAPQPFPYVSALSDPQFPTYTTPINSPLSNSTIPTADGWGIRILSSSSLAFYGAGLYSFFNNYSTKCSDQGNGEVCQNRIVYIDMQSSGVTLYNLNTVGTHYQVTVGDQDVVYYADNLDGFVDTVARFTTG